MGTISLHLGVGKPPVGEESDASRVSPTENGDEIPPIEAFADLLPEIVRLK
jgi:hypothetical protein